MTPSLQHGTIFKFKSVSEKLHEFCLVAPRLQLVQDLSEAFLTHLRSVSSVSGASPPAFDRDEGLSGPAGSRRLRRLPSARLLLPELYGLGRFQALQPAEQPAFLPALQPAADSCGRIDCNHDRRRVASALQSAGGRSVALPVGKVGINSCLNFCSCTLERLCPRFSFRSHQPIR